MELPFAELYKIKMVETIKQSTREQREQWLAEAYNNVFNLRSEYVFIDLLTDSGTGAMSDKQWSEMMVGDESYAGASSYIKMKETIKTLFGFNDFLPTHQGRAAENVLFSVLVKEGDIIPGNSHFDTTKGHIEFRKAQAVDCTIDEAFDTTVYHPFKGNLDLNKLTKVFEENPLEKIPMVIVTVTNNTSGGQPVSMQNLKEVSALTHQFGAKVVMDSARFAENAYFIKKREEGYADKTIKEIVKEMYSYTDAMTMSSKKDAIVNMGGFIGFSDRALYEKASVYNIMFEGFVTYGGMSGRDMNALCQGLDEATEFDYLDTRIRQVEYLADKLLAHGVPILQPTGGHAIFIDATSFFPEIPKEEFIAQRLVVELYLEAGLRTVEIGTILADRDPETRENRYPKLELVRLAIPRRVYTNSHMDYIAAAVCNVFDRRKEITRGMKILKEAPIMRHFTVELARL